MYHLSIHKPFILAVFPVSHPHKPIYQKVYTPHAGNSTKINPVNQITTAYTFLGITLYNSGMEKFHTLANERVVKMPSKLYPQGKAVLDVMTAIVAASGKYPIAKTRIADLHEFELLARATIGTCWREGNMLKVVRNLEGISLQKLAEKSGVSKNTIFRIENNQSIPRIDVLRKLADALEAPLELVAIGIGKTEPETTPEEEIPNPNAPKLPSVYDSQDRSADDEIKAFQE